jgi:hypothetical protein
MPEPKRHVRPRGDGEIDVSVDAGEYSGMTICPVLVLAKATTQAEASERLDKVITEIRAVLERHPHVRLADNMSDTAGILEALEIAHAVHSHAYRAWAARQAQGN